MQYLRYIKNDCYIHKAVHRAREAGTVRYSIGSVVFACGEGRRGARIGRDTRRMEISAGKKRTDLCRARGGARGGVGGGKG